MSLLLSLQVDFTMDQSGEDILSAAGVVSASVVYKRGYKESTFPEDESSD